MRIWHPRPLQVADNFPWEPGIAEPPDTEPTLYEPTQ
jgi:hypothetical protein